MIGWYTAPVKIGTFYVGTYMSGDDGPFCYTSAEAVPIAEGRREVKKRVKQKPDPQWYRRFEKRRRV